MGCIWSSEAAKELRAVKRQTGQDPELHIIRSEHLENANAAIATNTKSLENVRKDIQKINVQISDLTLQCVKSAVPLGIATTKFQNLLRIKKRHMKDERFYERAIDQLTTLKRQPEFLDNALVQHKVTLLGNAYMKVAGRRAFTNKSKQRLGQTLEDQIQTFENADEMQNTIDGHLQESQAITEMSGRDDVQDDDITEELNMIMETIKLQQMSGPQPQLQTAGTLPEPTAPLLIRAIPAPSSDAIYHQEAMMLN